MFEWLNTRRPSGIKSGRCAPGFADARRRPRRIVATAVLLLLGAVMSLCGGPLRVGVVSAQETFFERAPAAEGILAAAAPTELDRPTAAHPHLDRRETLVASLTIFVLAIFLGFELITKVPPTLHTPLMSGANAISGITVVGALLATGVATDSRWATFWGALAIILAMINAVGGFAVTHRMLAMFRRK